MNYFFLNQRLNCVYEKILKRDFPSFFVIFHVLEILNIGAGCLFAEMERVRREDQERREYCARLLLAFAVWKDLADI